MSGTAGPTPTSREERERVAFENAPKIVQQHPGVSATDALNIASIDYDLAQLEADDGSHQVPWLSAAPRSEPAKPWSDEDWQMDSRRAAAHGLQLSRHAWQAHAEQGEDAVALAFADRKRQQRISLQGRRNQILSSALLTGGK